MNARQKKQEAVERLHAEMFLKLSNLPYRIREGERNPRVPDFLLDTLGGIAGLEITSLYKDEKLLGGSPHRQRESWREHYLNVLKTTYYSKGGKPAEVSAILPDGELSDSSAAKLARRLRMARPQVVGSQKRFQIDLGHNMIATFFVEALPDELGEYAGWTCVNNNTGWVRQATATVLSETIDKKSKNLPRYAEAAKRTFLLIVAQTTQDSGMFDYAPTALLPSQGFAEVHLLIYPLKCCRIA